MDPGFRREAKKYRYRLEINRQAAPAK